jgi:Mucin-2 protein WxxW repeating region
VKKMTYRLIALSLAMISSVGNAETLEAYVQKCETELGFSASDVPPLNCNDGVVFRALLNSPVLDFSGAKRVTDNVDVVFACRWMSNRNFSTANNPPSFPFQTAVSVETIFHNRQNGNTCFFASKPQTAVTGADGTVYTGNLSASTLVSTAIVSPADPNASSYWLQPVELNTPHPNANLACAGCHIAGPYIASPEIAPVLARFGLLNDGHDTKAIRYHAVGSVNALFVANPSAFVRYDRAIKFANVQDTCASACHSIGLKSTAGPVFASTLGFTLVPSLLADISDVANAGVMPANAPTNGDPNNDYRWVNLDTPTNGDDGEYETLSNLAQQYPLFACSNPTSFQAHAVGSDAVMSPTDLPDRLHVFNLQDGLVCVNGEQDGGRQCNDYQTRYMCNGVLTAWQSRDQPSGSGDWEPRGSFGGCASPTAIQARTKVAGRWIYADGPNDRLAEFDNNGLICRSTDQVGGQTCSNYVVRFGCTAP